MTTSSSLPSSSHESPDGNPETHNDHPSLTREKIDISSLQEREEIAEAKWLKVPKFLEIAYKLIEAVKAVFGIYELIKAFLHRH